MANPKKKDHNKQVRTGSRQTNVRLSLKAGTSFSKMHSKTIKDQVLSKPTLRIKSAKKRSTETPSQMTLPTSQQQQQSYSNDQHQQLLQSDLHSAIVTIQSLINQNNSRDDNFNTNAFWTFRKEKKPNKTESDKESQDNEANMKNVSFEDEKNNAGSGKNKTNKNVSGDGDSNPQFSYEDQILVEVKMVLIRVLNIDTANQQFEAQIYIQARWIENQFSGYSEEQLQEIEFYQCWDPMLTIVNSVGTSGTDKAFMLLRYEPDRVYPVLTYMWHVNGIFRETLELQHFPFDVQEISIVLSSERGVKELELVPDYSQLSNVSPRALQGNTEWTAYRHITFTRDYNTSDSSSSIKHPILVAEAHIKRNLGYYFWNVFIIVLLILCLSFVVLGIAPYHEARLTVTITLFLTCIVYKLVLRISLPNTSYLTYLDMYVVFALILLALQAVENSIMIHLKKFKSNAKIELYDEIAQGLLIALLIIFHLVFIIYIQITAFSRRRTMNDKELDYEVSKINLNRTGSTGKPGTNNEMTEGENPQTSEEQSIEVENPLFKHTQTSDSLLASLRDRY